MRLSYDLHIHSCLSPCGDADMTPNNIVHMALLAGFDMIALTDHNTCGNCPAVLTVAREAGLIAVPGMELCTAEEAHVVCLFPELEAAMAFDAAVAPTLPPVRNLPGGFQRAAAALTAAALLHPPGYSARAASRPGKRKSQKELGA